MDEDTNQNPIVVLMAEDSEHDIRATKRVWEKQKLRNPLVIVRDGQECMDYLLRQGAYADDGEKHPFPGILLLDLNLPKIDGFEILKRIKETPVLRRLPVVVMTTSTRDEDKVRAYDLGVNAFMSKPVGLDKLSQALLAFNVFWEIVGLPVDVGDGHARNPIN